LAPGLSSQLRWASLLEVQEKAVQAVRKDHDDWVKTLARSVDAMDMRKSRMAGWTAR
jgi:hypothetical protein